MEKWLELLEPKDIELAQTLAQKTQTQRDNGATIYPPQDKIFRALELTSPQDLKVCILGQDPYHNGVANGLAFSVSQKSPLPPSLKNIMIELQSDLNIPLGSRDLTPWAKNGVLLLNTVLTVYPNQPNSHKGWGWQKFTKKILRASMQLPQPIVYIGWGAFAIDAIISSARNLPIVYADDGVAWQQEAKKGFVFSSHPSPLSCRKKGKDGVPAFLGSRPFSKTNELLEKMGGEPMNWKF